MRKHHQDNGHVVPDQGSPSSREGVARRLWRLKNRVGFWTLLLSLLIHVGVVLVLPLLLSDDPNNKRAEALRMWLNKKPATEIKEAPKVDKKTIVQITPTFKTKRPDKAEYLAEHDASTAEEKRAKPSTAQKQKSAAADDSKPTKAQPERPSSDEAPLGHKPKKRVNKNDPLGLRPQFSDGAAATAPSEFLPDVKEGSETELNTWQWRHAPFFNRVKTRIGQVWSPQSQIARFDPQGVLLGQKDRVTVLQVTIDRSGNLRDLKIRDESGVTYLDDEAERAFRVAAPFLYPPQELFATSDEFSFTFAFHLYLDRGFSFGFDWQKD